MRSQSSEKIWQWGATMKSGWRPHHLGWLAVAVLLVVCGGCNKGSKGMNAADTACLEALAVYHPKHKLDEAGRITELRLDGRHVNDSALDEVQKLSELRVLSLYGSSVTDAGLAKLNGLIYLEALGLGATPITDQGLIYLEQLPSLRWLWLTENKKITDQGVQQLKKKALPGLTVYR